MPRKKKTEAKSDAVPTPIDAPVVSEEQAQEPVKYVVTRAGFRVSEAEYTDPQDEVALRERDFWNRVAKAAKDGSSAQIVQFNKRLHRIW